MNISAAHRKLVTRKRVRELLVELFTSAQHVLLIHYSCESFHDISNGHTPRVTSIALRNLKTAQTESFSIHKVAERQHIPFDEIKDNYDKLEHEMLSHFYDYIRQRQNVSFIHWNMRDGNFGFSAIAHRFEVLGGQPHVIPDEKKHDLARMLVDLFGKNYVGHGNAGRLHELIHLNNITDKDALIGQEEAEAFVKREYVKLHQSTLRKVDCIANIVERIVDGTLKTNAPWKDTYGLSLEAFIEVLQTHWFTTLITLVASIIGIIGYFIGFSELKKIMGL